MGVEERWSDEAKLLVSLSKQLDYEKIIAHDKDEVVKLISALRSLGVSGPEAKKQQESSESLSAEDKRVSLLRRRKLLDILNTQGFVSRVGMYYCPNKNPRIQAFKRAPHRNGLPAFDLVIAPDYSPTSNSYAIFIAGDRVLSAVLNEKADDGCWEIYRDQSFADLNEMVEIVSLMSVGFDA